MTEQTHAPSYGSADATYQALGGEQGIRQVVDRFYHLMESDSRFQTIWSWHKDNPAIMRDKLTVFLSGWTGGPRNYRHKYGGISIPGAHGHLRVGESERDQWLDCMRQALQHFHAEDLVEYMISQLSVPAERIRQYCEKAHRNDD